MGINQMPKWKDKGIILKSDKHGEKGYDFNCFYRRTWSLPWMAIYLIKKNFFQPGDIVELNLECKIIRAIRFLILIQVNLNRKNNWRLF